MGLLIYLGVGVFLAFCMKTKEGNLFDTDPKLGIILVVTWPFIIIALIPRIKKVSFRNKVFWERKD